MPALAPAIDRTAAPNCLIESVSPPAEDGVALGYSEMDWDAVHSSNVSLLVQQRQRDDLTSEALTLLNNAPFEARGVGNVEQACAALGPLPAAIGQDIRLLAQCFARLMEVQHVRIRLDAVTTNSCRKIHADVTDLRLITTYSGPGTQVLRHGREVDEANLWSMQPGWVGLFKGKRFGKDHGVCLHRSPPAQDIGAKRLVLVIDGPQFASGPEA